MAPTSEVLTDMAELRSQLKRQGTAYNELFNLYPARVLLDIVFDWALIASAVAAVVWLHVGLAPLSVIVIANRQRALAGDYDVARTCAVPATGATLALKDIHAWFADMQNSHSMGNTACASIARNGNQFVITVDWDDSRASDNTETVPATVQDGVAARNRVITAVRL